MANLSRVTIQNFKSIENADFNLSDLNVFVGGNNSGKTTVVQAIHFAFTLFQSLQISGKWPSRNQRSSTLSPDELIYVPSLDPYSLGKGGKLREAEDQAIVFDFYFSDGEHAQLKVRKGRISNVLVEPTNTEYLRGIAGLNEPFSIFSPGLAGVSKSEPLVSDGVLLRALSRGDANAFLRNTLYRLHSKDDAWAEFNGDLGVLFPHLEFQIQFDENVDETISVMIRRGDVTVPLDLAGTGLLQAIQIFAYLHLFKPKIMVFDEPDSHLHPNNQRNLCAVFKSIAHERDTQVVLTTHSRHMIDSLSDDCDLVWMQDGTARPASRLDQVDLLVDLGALDVRERLENEQPRFVVLSEDTNSSCLEKLLLASGYQDDQFQIHSYKGVTNTHLLAPLIRQISDVCNTQIIVHRDRDFLEPDEVAAWEQAIRALGAEPFVTADKDIEGYLITDQILESELANLPNLNLTQLKEAAVNGQEDQIIQGYVNGRVDIERKAGRGNRINHGTLAATAATRCLASPWNMMLPKLRLRRIRKVLQDDYRHRLATPSIDDFTADSTLEAILLRT